jgi:hypothetical protein
VLQTVHTLAIRGNAASISSKSVIRSQGSYFFQHIKTICCVGIQICLLLQMNIKRRRMDIDTRCPVCWRLNEDGGRNTKCYCHVVMHEKRGKPCDSYQRRRHHTSAASPGARPRLAGASTADELDGGPPLSSPHKSSPKQQLVLLPLPQLRSSR